MTRRRLDSTLIQRAFVMREQGCSVADILSATGISQGSYYAYIHRHEQEVEQRYSTDAIQPMLTWPGSKSSELDRLMTYVPDFDGTYYEPFCGSAAMFYRLKPERALLSDASPELIGFYGAVRDRYHQLHDELSQLEHEFSNYDDEGKRQMYRRIRDIMNGTTYGDASVEAAFFIINKTSFSGMIRRNRMGLYNVPYGKGKSFKADTITELHQRALRDAELLCCDFESALSRCKPDDFVFLDPPYDNDFADYSMAFGEDEHRRLAEVFYELPCPALMVVNRTPLTLELYDGDIIDEYAREYLINVAGRVSSSNVHLVVGYRRSKLMRI